MMLVILLALCNVALVTGQSTTLRPGTNEQTTNPTPGTTYPSRENKTRCYPFVGCFDNFAPFDNAHLDLPNSPDSVGTEMHLYTRLKNASDVIDYKDLNTITKSSFSPSRKTKFIIHGFSNTFKSPWIHEMKDALLKKGDFNVVIVAWGPGAAFPDYDQAVANTRMVGTQLRLVIDLMTRAGASLDDVHLIGHSLGAHTSGYAGYLLHGRLGRISGLDAAEPDFEHHPMQARLDSSDAQFVDVIHTNGAPFSSFGAGLMQVSGHVDFYLNGGEVQPGCPGQVQGVFSDLFHGNFGNMGDTVSCSHSRSHMYFTESILSQCPFTAYPCDNYESFKNGSCYQCTGTGCSQMGYYADQYDARGKLFINTMTDAPFCGFQYFVRVIAGTKDTVGTLSIRIHGNWGTTDWVAVTDKDTELKANSVHNGVVVSRTEVGDIESIDVKYQKYQAGFIFGSSGNDEWELSKVTAVSGEFGDSYLFCLGGNVIRHNAELNFRSGLRNQC